MKKLSILSIALSAALFTGVASANTAYDGKITFRGKVVDNTCTVTTGKKDLEVILPTVSTKTLEVAESTAGSTEFTVDLENCKAANAQQNGTTVRLYFLPTLTNPNVAKNDLLNAQKGVLLNKATNNPASKVGIQILDSRLTPIPLGKDISGYTQNTDKVALSPNVSLAYNARYYALEGNVTAGEVEATVQYSIVYD